MAEKMVIPLKVYETKDSGVVKINYSVFFIHTSSFTPTVHQ